MHVTPPVPPPQPAVDPDSEAPDLLVITLRVQPSDWPWEQRLKQALKTLGRTYLLRVCGGRSYGEGA